MINKQNTKQVHIVFRCSLISQVFEGVFIGQFLKQFV